MRRNAVFYICLITLACTPIGLWADAFDTAETHPFAFEAGLTQIYQANTRGGLNTHQHRGRYSGSYDLGLTLDLAQISSGLEGQFFVHGEGGWTDSEGIDGTSVGSVFGVNADAIGNRSLDIVEAFYTGAIRQSGISVSLGKIDFSGFYDASAYANDETSQFLNGALVNNPTIPFPDYSLGVIAAWTLSSHWTLMAGIADAQAVGKTTGFHTTFHGEDYFFSLFELAYESSVESSKGLLNGTLRVGLWNDPQPKAQSDSARTHRDDWGYYVSADHMLFNENATPTDSQGLGLFVRYGHANDRRNDVTDFVSVGLHYQGLWDTRDEDVLGIGMAQGTFSDQAKQTYTQDYERVTELYYKAIVSNSLYMTPTLQYVKNPGGTHTSDAWVAGVRAQIDF